MSGSKLLESNAPLPKPVIEALAAVFSANVDTASKKGTPTQIADASLLKVTFDGMFDAASALTGGTPSLDILHAGNILSGMGGSGKDPAAELVLGVLHGKIAELGYQVVPSQQGQANIHGQVGDLLADLNLPNLKASIKTIS